MKTIDPALLNSCRTGTKKRESVLRAERKRQEVATAEAHLRDKERAAAAFHDNIRATKPEAPENEAGEEKVYVVVSAILIAAAFALIAEGSALFIFGLTVSGALVGGAMMLAILSATRNTVKEYRAPSGRSSARELFVVGLLSFGLYPLALFAAGEVHGEQAWFSVSPSLFMFALGFLVVSSAKKRTDSFNAWLRDHLELQRLKNEVLIADQQLKRAEEALVLVEGQINEQHQHQPPFVATPRAQNGHAAPVRD